MTFEADYTCTIALVGSGEYLPPMEPVDRLLLERLTQEPSVVCLPTAAGMEGAGRIGYWSHLGVQHFSRLGVDVQALPVVDRASANDPKLAESIRAANFVYLSGGNPYYLLRTLAGSLAWDAILSVLAHGGILAGCSAGAMVLGTRLLGFPTYRAAFDLLPGSLVLPHFDEVPKALIPTLRFLMPRSLALVGIEGDTALIYNGSSAAVFGSGAVIIWTPRRKLTYTAGPLPEDALQA